MINMRYEDEYFIIESDKNLDYFDEVVDYINTNVIGIFRFFNIDNLDNKINIKIQSYESFKEFIVNKYGEILDYYCGDSDSRSHTIRILNIDDQIKYTKHKNADIEKIKTTALHEIIHQLHHLYGGNYTNTTWFGEGLATNLSFQNYHLTSLDDCDFERLKHDFSHYRGGYSYAYSIINYVLNNYKKEDIDKLVKDPEEVRKNADRIFNEAKKWVSDKLNGKKYDVQFESDRLLFVKLSQDLVPNYVEMLNDEELQHFNYKNKKIFTKERELLWVRINLYNGNLVYSMLEKDTMDFVGNIELWIDGKSAEFGINITKSKRNKHYGQEATKRLLEYAFSNYDIEKIELDVYNFNDRGIQCYKNAGFVEEGKSKEPEDIHMVVRR